MEESPDRGRARDAGVEVVLIDQATWAWLLKKYTPLDGKRFQL
jgi:hypothetical protein